MMTNAQRREARRVQSQRARKGDETTAFSTVLRHQPIGSNATHNLVLAEEAFRDLAAGSDDHDLFGCLAMAINCALIRAEAIDALLEKTMLDATIAMNDAQGIFERHGRYGFTGPGLIAVRHALDGYDAIARESSPVQMQAALTEVMRRYADQRADA